MRIMHAKTDSGGTSEESLSPPRSPVYYVQGPKDINARWKQFQIYHLRADDDHSDDDDDEVRGGIYNLSWQNVRSYVLWSLFFLLLFTTFCLILWGASKAYNPEILVKSIVFENFYVQAGSDQSGIPTDMLSLNSTVKIHYKNPATFFGVHVTCTPMELYYLQLKIASGQMMEFYESRESHRTITTVIHGHQVPLYGVVPPLLHVKDHIDDVEVPLNLTFVVRSRAYILGHLVQSEFRNHVTCSVTLTGNNLGKPHHLLNSCYYD